MNFFEWKNEKSPFEILMFIIVVFGNHSNMVRRKLNTKEDLRTC